MNKMMNAAPIRAQTGRAGEGVHLLGEQARDHPQQSALEVQIAKARSSSPLGLLLVAAISGIVH